MAKLILLSVIFANIALPARAANIKNPRKGLRKTLLHMAVFNFIYIFSVLYLYGRV